MVYDDDDVPEEDDYVDDEEFSYEENEENDEDDQLDWIFIRENILIDTYIYIYMSVNLVNVFMLFNDTELLLSVYIFLKLIYIQNY